MGYRVHFRNGVVGMLSHQYERHSLKGLQDCSKVVNEADDLNDPHHLAALRDGSGEHFPVEACDEGNCVPNVEKLENLVDF